jgi:predicted esterase
MTQQVETHSVPTLTHGRVLVRPARTASARGVLVGFHGYGENAAMQLQRLQDLPGAASWTLLSVQGLHRFYDPRSNAVVASWMTSEDRADAIADNLAYITAALEGVHYSRSAPIVFAGFSQGAAMAYRAGCRGPVTASAIIAVGGDVPPELLEDRSVEFPRVLMLRGEADRWYGAEPFAEDAAALSQRGVAVTALTLPGGHEWTADTAAVIGEFLAG